MLDSAPSPAQQRTVPVLALDRLAQDTYRIRLADPALASAIRPGQFVMVRPARGSGPLLGRPFALYDVVRSDAGEPVAVDLVFVTLGEGTLALARLRPGDEVTAWGPLGVGFGLGPGLGQPVVFVAGGIGQTPFLTLAQGWLGRATFGGDPSNAVATTGPITLLYGVRSAAFLAGVADFEAAGIAVEVATDDGSAGHHGRVTDLLAQRLSRGERPAHVVGCGPPAMLAALSRLAERHDLPCTVSLENHMACGFGVCYSCVAPIRQPDGSVDLRRVCVEGPIFDARAVAWPADRPSEALG